MDKQPCVYILSSRKNGDLYTGVTANLDKRICQQKTRSAEGFSSKYNVCSLVWYEEYDSMDAAIEREKIVKNWQRGLKVQAIEKSNPQWRDLYPEVARPHRHN